MLQKLHQEFKLRAGKKMDKNKQLIALVLCSLASVAQAGEKEELLKLRNTTTNLIKELVKQGVLTEKVAAEMIKKAESDAEAQAQNQTAATQTAPDAAPEPGEVRVPYVPDFVKDEIRKQVRTDLREEVVSEVMQKAKNEKWGTPDALPDWVNRFKLSGDLRLRSQNEFMASDNATGFVNYQAIDVNGGLNRLQSQPLLGQLPVLNTTNNRQRFRERLRLAIDAQVTDGVQAGIRLATGNMPDPVSTNQTLGNTGSQYQFNLDRAFLKYEAINDKGFKWLTVSGGRIANPYYVGGAEFTGGSELVWDTDLSFEGLAATTRYSLGNLLNQQTKDDGSRNVYATVGGFPLQESAYSSGNKWLFGGQVGLDWGFKNSNALKSAVAYYDYRNMQATPNSNGNCATNSANTNLSVPQFLQWGNTLSSVCSLVDANGNPTGITNLYGLASDFKIVNANLSYDLANFAPYHIIVGADFAKNVGYNINNANLLNRVNNNQHIGEQTNAWQARVDFGHPKVDRSGQWNVFSLYKYVERDAVVDAYTDSDFHLGGTNAKGWVVGGNYGLMKNVWFTGRWLSTDVISGPKYSNDILQLDLNTKF